jgi:sRNA-binding carbon storage regulator CsrA
MAGHSVGKIFVELDLDTEGYTKKQKELVRDATRTSLNLEDNFKKLGIKSAQEMDLMRQKITNSYAAIANNAKAKTNDILRAEKAKNEQLRKLDIEQYGERKKLEKDATRTSLNLEDNFKKLGIKSAQEMDLMRQEITNTYAAIANNAKAKTNEIVRAEKAKNEQVKKLDIEQYGERISLINKFKKHWLASIAVIYVAWKAISGTVKFVGGIVKDATLAAGRYETLGVAMRTVGANAGYTGEQMENFAKGLQKKNIAMTESRQVLTMMVEAQMDLNNANRLARIAQHAAVIGNINSSEAMQQMIWGIQSANIRVLRTIGINVSFEASYQKMATALNKTGSAVKRTAENLTELEKITARTGAVMDFEAKLKTTYEASMETAQKQLLSLKRHFDNLKVLVGTVFTPILLEGVQFVTGAVSDLNGEMEVNQRAMFEYGQRIRLNLIDLRIYFMELQISFIKMKNSIPDIGGWIAKFAPKDPKAVTGHMGQQIKTFADLIKTNQDLLQEKYGMPKEDPEERRLETLPEVVALTEEINAAMTKQADILYSLTDAGRAEAEASRIAAEKKLIALNAEAKAAEDLQVQMDQDLALEEKAQDYIDDQHERSYGIRKKDSKQYADWAEERKKVLAGIADSSETSFDKETILLRKQREQWEEQVSHLLKLGYDSNDAKRDMALINEWELRQQELLYDKEVAAQRKKMDEIQNDREKADEKLVNLSKRSAQAMEEAFSDLFYDAMVGELKRLDEYVLSFLQSLARSFADFYAQMARNYIVKSIANAAWNTDYGAQPGDVTGPMSSSSTSQSSSVARGDTYNVNITAVDSRSFSQLVEENPGAVTTVVQKAMKNNTSLRNTMRRTA